MARRPRINSIRVASTDNNMIRIFALINWKTALNTSHIPTLEACLKDAVESEQYEYAAEIRDRIKEVRELKPIVGPWIDTVEPPY